MCRRTPRLDTTESQAFKTSNTLIAGCMWVLFCDKVLCWLAEWPTQNDDSLENWTVQ